MGSLTLPNNGPIYMDANAFIYTVERIAPYYPVLDTFWNDLRTKRLSVVTSEITILEVLTKPLQQGNAGVESAFRAVLFSSPDVQLYPISRVILERAAHLRATSGLKTPDAIHAATALEHGCAIFVTNDPAFRRVATLPTVILGDLLAP